ncbi:MAG: hypothetical protein EBS92_03765 [Proteobacteria bacterium]|nr:hypothetical protein [Pseudomonadota bacterium]
MRLNFLEKLNAKLSNFKNKINLKKGFSLNDLSVMISTVLIVTATSVAITEIKTDSKKSELDSAKFEKINKSLSKFLIQNKRLPCPAGLRIVKGTSSEYGKEQISANNCVIDGTKGVFVSSSNPNLLYGAVPAQSLGLKPSDIEDQFGSKIVYVVNIKSTVAPSTDPNSVNENIGSATTSIKINEKSGDNIKEIDSDALYVLISAGKNKNGAFNANSSAQNSNASTTSTEASNFPTSISGSTVVIDDVFVKSETKSGGNFDDLIFYKTKSTFLEESKTETVITCKNSGTLYDNKNAFFEGIIYANQSCSGSNKRPAKKCGKDGKWTQEVSCPCSISTDGIVGTKSVPNGSGGIKCDATNYSGILQYSCDELGSYTITETCKQSCTFQATGVSQVTIPYGSNKVDCNQSGYKGGYIITCNNGISAIQSGGCSDSKCSSIGGSSGMKLLTNIISGTSSTFGICESGYSGSYSYSCENGISNVTDLCYQNCNFSLIGAETKTLTHGDSTVACASGYSGQGVSVNCNDGVILVKNNNCIKVDKCTVGVGTGMVSKEVLSDGILKSDGTCKSGFTGSYSYKCSSNNISETTNNCVPTNCVVGDQLGLTPKTVTKGTSGVDGQCASGYGGFYKWSCSSSGVGSVTENNCKNTCIVGGTNGSIQQVVAFGRSGNDGLCDISQGYVGNYSWACAVNASTGMLEGVVSLNLCKNLCTVGTSSQGVGMVQKNVSLNSIGQDGQCNSGSGYVGNYAWKCDFAGNSVVTTNNCKNSCEVGASSQGVGMVQKTVSLNTNGTNGLCNDSQGYAGNYSWSCTTPLVNGVSQAVGSVTVNNCQLRTCVVGGSSGMVSKTVNALTSGTNGTCQTGFYGSYSWSCSNTGVGSVTNNCVAITCTVPANITGFVSGTSGINFGTASYFCNAPGYRTDSSANFECSANPNTSIGTFTQNSNSCSKITCNASAVAGFNAKTVEHNSFVSSLPCDTTGYIGSLTNNCTTHNSTITPSGSCTAVTCSLSAGNGYSAKTNLSYTTSGLTTTCDQTGYTGTISYTCPANPTSASVVGSIVSGSSCACATGYAKNASGACVQITCTVPSNINVSQGGNTVSYSTSSVSLSCVSGFYGSPTYTCTGTTNPGTFSSAGTTCSAVTCTLPTGTGYSAKSGLTYTSSASGLTTTCDQTGYTGTISYTCPANPTSTSVAGSIVSGSSCGCASGYAKNASGACVLITCSIPAGTGYSAQNVGLGTGSISCQNGYTGSINYECTCDKVFAYNDPDYAGGVYGYPLGNYYCWLPNGNDVISSLKIPNTLSVTLCYHCESACNYTFNSSAPNLYSSGIDNNASQLYVSSTGQACSSPVYNISGSCVQATCTVPSNINVTQGGSTVNATSTATSLTCASGYAGSPTYTCISGVFASGGTSCTPITCHLPN